MVRIPGQPGEEQHEHQGQCRGQPGQCPHQQGHTQEDFPDGGEHTQFKGIGCPGLQIQSPGLEVLLELVHEPEGIVDLDQAGHHKQGADEDAANVGDGKKDVAHGMTVPNGKFAMTWADPTWVNHRLTPTFVDYPSPRWMRANRA